MWYVSFPDTSDTCHCWITMWYVSFPGNNVSHVTSRQQCDTCHLHAMWPMSFQGNVLLKMTTKSVEFFVNSVMKQREHDSTWKYCIWMNFGKVDLDRGAYMSSTLTIGDYNFEKFNYLSVCLWTYLVTTIYFNKKSSLFSLSYRNWNNRTFVFQLC